jgi:hypothetical protein
MSDYDKKKQAMEKVAERIKATSSLTSEQAAKRARESMERVERKEKR